MRAIMKKASHLSALPGLSRFSPTGERHHSAEVLEGYLRCQRLGQRGAHEVGKLIQEGWTENRAAKLFKTFLMDSGVRAFFHEPFVWFGDRTRFEGIRRYSQYQSGKQRILPGQVFILDVAPIYHGFIADIGVTSSLGENTELDEAKQFLGQLRKEIPELVLLLRSGKELLENLEKKIKDAGYENIHQKYPFSVLGHRVHETSERWGSLGLLNFGWQSYWEFLSRGLFGQLLNRDFEGKMTGLWAIEPHIGTPTFGAKFEEILIVEDHRVKWLESQPQYGESFL